MPSQVSHVETVMRAAIEKMGNTANTLLFAPPNVSDADISTATRYVESRGLLAVHAMLLEQGRSRPVILISQNSDAQSAFFQAATAAQHMRIIRPN